LGVAVARLDKIKTPKALGSLPENDGIQEYGKHYQNYFGEQERIGSYV
jgi:hypothetical protein